MIKRILKYVGNGLVIILLLILLFLIIGSRFTGTDFFTIYTGSMKPVIPIGSTVIVQPIKESHIKVGDILAFHSSTNSETVVHRVIEVKNENSSFSYHTAGDANNSPDVDLVPAKNVIGKVFFIIPYWGYLSDFVRTKLGYVLLVILPGLVFVSFEIRNVIRELRRIKTLIPENSCIVSQVHDTTIMGAAWDYLSWNESLQANTDFIFDVRASDTPFAEDDPLLAWTPVGENSPVTSGLPSKRYIQWRAIPTSSDKSKAHVLNEINVEHY